MGFLGEQSKDEVEQEVEQESQPVREQGVSMRVLGTEVVGLHYASSNSQYWTTNIIWYTFVTLTFLAVFGEKLVSLYRMVF